MRISDWSSDVCSSDLSRSRPRADRGRRTAAGRPAARPAAPRPPCPSVRAAAAGLPPEGYGRRPASPAGDRKSVVEGKSVSVRVDLGGRRIIKKKKKQRIPKTPTKANNLQKTHQ